MNAGRWSEAIALRGELVRRIEAQRAATRAPAGRRALAEAWLPRYREYAAALAVAGRGAEAYAAAELVKTRALLDLSAAAGALEAGPLPASKAALLEDLRAPAVEELRALLPPGSAYVSYVVQSNLFLVIALSPELGGEIHRPPLVPNLSASIAAWRFLLAIPEAWRGRIASLPKAWRRKDGSFQVAAKPPEAGAREVSDAAEIADWLGGRLLGPAAKHLAGARRLVVSPDADLAFAPFEALRLGGRYLAESHEVSYTPAAGMYALSRARAEEYRQLGERAGVLAVGGALYEPFVRVTPMLSVHHDLLYALPRQLRPGAARNPAPSTVADAFRALKVAWANLPGTAEEAARVAALFEQGRVLAGADASERRLLELNASGELSRYRHLLFATHGYLSPYDPRLSSVVLSQMGNQAPHDGYVTAAEWPRYDLRSDLVLVAAANSGFGPAAASEGLLGLPFALHLAGNRNTTLSLWTLNDPLTARFVAQFFARVRDGADHAAALAATKRAFIAEGVPASYWAPFVLHGS
ncbi:MAG: CHAT domain-containing protein [Betaproteobacteria bacterium]